MPRNPPERVWSASDYYGQVFIWSVDPRSTEMVSKNWYQYGINILNKVRILPPSSYNSFLAWLSLTKQPFVNNEMNWPEEIPGCIGGFFLLQRVGGICGPRALENDIIAISTQVVVHLWTEYQQYQEELNRDNAGVVCDF